MNRVRYIYLLLLIPASCYGQNNGASSFSFKQATDTTVYNGFSIRLDAKIENLLVYSNGDSAKLYGIKIFTADGEEVVSKLIQDTSTVTTIPISKLPDGNYIIHLVTADQAIYKSKVTISR